MIVSHKHRFLFISNPKTGTHTMYDYLPKHYEGERIGGFHDTRIPEECKDYFIFTTFRYPFERLVSAWNSLLFQDKYRRYYMNRIGGDSFPEFVDWLTSYPNDTAFTSAGGPVLCLQSVWLRNCIDHINDFVFTEFMNEDFAKLPFTNGQDDVGRELHRPHDGWEKMKDQLTDQQILNLEVWLDPDFQIYQEGLYCND